MNRLTAKLYSTHYTLLGGSAKQNYVWMLGSVYRLSSYIHYVNFWTKPL